MGLSTVTSAPAVTPVRPQEAAHTAEWTSQYMPGPNSQSSEDDEGADSTSVSAMSVFNGAMDNLNQVATSASHVSPLTFQLKTVWDEAKEEEKEVCIDKATEACSLACDVITPKAGQELFQACFTPDKVANYGDLVPLMRAFTKATTRNVKAQILNPDSEVPSAAL